MPKDSKDSLEQIKWQNAVRFHTEYTEMLKTATLPSVIFRINEQLTEYEKQYPQLKQK